MKYKYFKPNFVFFLINTFFLNLLIYLFQFYQKKDEVNYYLCTSIYEYQIKIFSFNVEFIYPESCDLSTYQQGVLNFTSFFNLSDYVYQDRPLFIFYIFIFYSFISLFFGMLLTDLWILKFSFFLGQLFLTAFVSLFIYRIFILLDLRIAKNYFFFPLFISLSPMYKWHIYESTSMTFTMLIIVYGIYIVLNENITNRSFIFIGLLFLVHRSAILILVFYILYKIIISKVTFNLINKFLYAILPIVIYYLLVFIFSNFSDHQAQGYRQFIWIFDYLNGEETMKGGYFCQTPRDALLCYLRDVYYLIKYLAAPSLFLIFFLISKYKLMSEKLKKFIYISISFAFLINLFWLFIGWYPPVRFSYYGYGNLVILLLIFSINMFNDPMAKTIFISAFISYFLFLNHWNSPEVIFYSSYIKISFLLFFSSLVIENSKKST